ncbi:uncharacterized protein METZ01_LOCUS366199 [marine metagenome]|uniref:Uncharacterized protein n=1 Tax=marine metagenome TaxID=408172 RepID=A0A382SV71_9ZZZZ
MSAIKKPISFSLTHSNLKRFIFFQTARKKQQRAN